MEPVIGIDVDQPPVHSGVRVETGSAHPEGLQEGRLAVGGGKARGWADCADTFRAASTPLPELWRHSCGEDPRTDLT